MIFQPVLRPVLLRHTRFPLAGDLVLPAGPGPFPAVALLGGESGPRDRTSWVDELAWSGLMSLTWDSPGWGDSPGPGRWQRPDERVAELLAAVDHLDGDPEVPAGDVGVIASGLGTLTALMAATHSSRIHALVLLSPPLTDVAEQEVARLGRRLRAARFAPAEVQLAQAVLRHRISSLRAGVPPEEVLAGEAAAALAPWYAWLRVGTVEDLVSFAVLDGYDVRSLLLAVRCPVLAVFSEEGDADTSWRDALAVRRCLDARGTRDHSVLVLPADPRGDAIPWEVTTVGPRMRPELSCDIVDVLTGWLGARLYRRRLRHVD